MTKLEEFDSVVAGMRKSLVEYLNNVDDKSVVRVEVELRVNEQVAPLIPIHVGATGPPCVVCGTLTVPAGSCHVCNECGASSSCG